MAIAEEAEKGSHGEGGGGRGTSAGSRRGADTSPRKKKKKGTKRLGQRIDFVLESPISLYHYYYCFSHHKLQDIFCTVLGGKQGVGGASLRPCFQFWGTCLEVELLDHIPCLRF